MEQKAENKTVFNGDRVVIQGPQVDGGYKVTFYIGETQYDLIKELPKLNGRVMVIAVVAGEEFTKKGVTSPVPVNGQSDEDVEEMGDDSVEEMQEEND